MLTRLKLRYRKAHSVKMPEHVRSSARDTEDRRDYKLDDLEIGTPIGKGMRHLVALD